MRIEASSLAELIPDDRSWVPSSIFLGLSIALLSCSIMLRGAEPKTAALVALFASGSFLICIAHMQRRSVIFSDRVLSSGLVIAGGAGASMPVVALEGPFLTIASFACLIFCLALALFSPKPQPPERLPLDEKNRALLAKPLAYLLICIAVSAMTAGLVTSSHAELMLEDEGRVGFFCGIIAAGLTLWGMMAATKPTRGLDWITRASLFLLFAALLFLSQSFAPGISLALLSFALSFVAFLLARMALDLFEVFQLPAVMPTATLLLAAMSLFVSVSAGDFLLSAELGKTTSVLSTIFALAMAATIVYGLSSERIWTAAELRSLHDRKAVETIPVRRPWRLACEEIAEKGGLTPREREVFILLAKGRNGPSIERELVISGHTVKTHTLSIYRKLGVHSAQELIDLVEAHKEKRRDCRVEKRIL